LPGHAWAVATTVAFEDFVEIADDRVADVDR
jgi:hypothetical protein